MEIQVENRVDIEPVTDVEIAASNVAEVSVADDTALDVSVVKKEYKIVGDEVYIAKLYEDAPQWMKDLVQLVVDNTMASESTVLLNNLVSQLNQFAVSYVPLNTYTQSILDLSNADTAMHDTIETLNSNFNDGLNEANSQIIDLQSTKASKTEVATKVVETLAAQLALPTSDIGSTIANLQQAIVNGDSANADSITTLTSVLEGEVDARASAIQTLNTYVGIDDTGTATGTGLLNSIQELQNQVDGNISTWFYSGAPTLSTAPANGWSTAEEKANHVGDIYYDRLTGYGYRFAYEDIVDTPDMGVIYSWIRIVDTDIVKALADAAAAQETADGKITTFYQASAPTAEGVGDIWIDSNDGNKMYRWNGTSWGADLVETMVASSSAVTALTTELSNGTNTWAAADSQVTNSLTTKIENDVASVESKWAYNSNLSLNGVSYSSGFGLATSLIDNTIPVGQSEFWIKSDKFRLMSADGTTKSGYSPFSVNAATGDILLNGSVKFVNTSGGSSTLQDVVQSYVETVQVGDKNINITDNLIPMTSLLGDANNAGYQFVGTPTKSSVTGISAYAEPQIQMDSGDEVYSPYVDELTLGYYYRFGIKGVTSLASAKICTIAGADVVTYGTISYTMDAGQSLVSTDWYIVDGLINPTGGATRVGGSIRKADGTKIGSVDIYVLPVGAARLLLGWVGPCIVSRGKLAKVSADTVTGDLATVDYVDSSISSFPTTDAGWQVRVQQALDADETVINGSKIITGSIEASSINTSNLIANNINSTSTIIGNTIEGSYIRGARIDGAVIKASYLDLDGELEVLTDYHISPAMYLANPALYTDAVYIEANNEYRIPTLSSVSSGTVTASVTIPDSSSYPAILSGQTLTRGKVYNSLLYPYNAANVNSNIKSRRIRPYFTSTATKLFYASLVSGVSSEVMLAAYVNIYIYFGDTLLLHVYGGSPGTAVYQTGYGAYYVNGVMFYGGSFSDPLITYTITVLGFTFTIKSGPGAYYSRWLTVDMSGLSEFSQLPFDFINSSIRVVTGDDMFIYTYSVTAPKIYINNML